MSQGRPAPAQRPGPGEPLRRVDALLSLGLRLARSASTGRVLLARLADAIDPVWIPEPRGTQLTAELRAAQAAAREPLAAGTIERALRSAWGAAATEELDALEPDPVAVTPSSQVHRASYEGAPVAVKVLRPGLADAIGRDLALLEGLLSPLSAAFPSVDAGAVLREVKERTLDELDLEHEAVTQRYFHRALRNHPFLTVPGPIMSLCHENVLVSEWVDGVSLWHAPALDQAAARLVVFALGAARSGMVHANLNPDDVLVRPDGRLAILDFGRARAVSAERVDEAIAALDGFAAGDASEFGVALERLGWLGAGHARAALSLGRAVLGEFAGAEPVRLDGDAVIAARNRLLARPQEVAELILAASLPAEDLWPARGVAELFGTIARVGASGPWRELARRALREGWSAAAD